MDFATHTVEPDGDEVALATLQGRKHLVAPVVLVREGVLNGGFLDYSEIERSEPGWNGRPVTAPPEADASGHPTDDDGEFVSANQDPYIEDMHVGRVRNTEAREDLPTPGDETSPRGLAGEAWVDVERTADVGEPAVEAARRLANGDKLEVSTGYWHAYEREAGSFNGEDYEQVQFDLMPDHLALLPNETGACSWADGCGAPRTADAAPTASTAEAINRTLGSRVLAVNSHVVGANLLEQARMPEFDGTESTEWSAPSLADYVDAFGYGDVDGVGDLTGEQKSAISETSLLGDASADSFAELVFFPVVDPDGRTLNENALDAVLSGRGAQADISDDQLQSARGIARTLLEREFDRDLDGNARDGAASPAVLDRIRDLLGMADGQGGAGPHGYDPTGGCACGPAANCECGGHDTTPNMNHDYEALAASTAFDLDTLKDMSDERLETLAETVAGFEADDGGDGTEGTDASGESSDATDEDDDEPATDGDTQSSGDGGDTGDVEALREQVETLTETVEDLATQANRDPQAEAAREYLAENTDHEQDELGEWPDAAALETARAHGFHGQAAGAAQGGAGGVGTQVGVNRMAQAGAASPAANGDDEDLDGYVANAGALANMDAGGAGGDA